MLNMGRIGAAVAVAAITAFSADARAVEGETDAQAAIHCLALNMYFEARNEPIDGKLAVGHVVLNRVADRRYPDKICNVVKQGGSKRRHKCQFSWYCDGLSDRPRSTKAWKESQVLARVVFWGYSEDPTNGALWYHADYVSPSWRRSMEKGPKIGRHLFYVAEVGRARARVLNAKRKETTAPEEAASNDAATVPGNAKPT